jgi:hypothetical protein
MDALLDELRDTNRFLRRLLYLGVGFGLGALLAVLWLLRWPV